MGNCEELILHNHTATQNFVATGFKIRPHLNTRIFDTFKDPTIEIKYQLV